MKYRDCKCCGIGYPYKRSTSKFCGDTCRVYYRRNGKRKGGTLTIDKMGKLYEEAQRHSGLISVKFGIRLGRWNFIIGRDE